MRIISQTPTRLSIFGGSTDVAPFSTIYGGICFNMGINIRQHIELNTESKKHDWIKKDSIDFINSFLSPLKVGECGIKHTFDGLSTESGLGSSASLAVALIGAVNKYTGKNMSKDEIAEKAWDIEVNKLGLYSGKQDQYCAVYGGVNIMEFKDKVTVTPLSPSFITPILPSLILFYTGKNRKSGKIQEGLKVLSEGQITALNEIKKICYEGIEAIANKDVEKVGRLLDCAWEMKKKSNKGVSNERIDSIYQTGKKAGALGFKILGAGGGGHAIFVCLPEKQERLKESLKKIGCRWVDFSVDWQGVETRII